MLSAVDGGAAEHAEAKQRDGGADAERPDEAQQRPDGAGRAQQHLQQRRAHDRALDLKHKPTLPPATGHSLRRHSTQAHTATYPPLVTHSDGIQHNSTKVHTATPPPTTPTGR